MTETRVEPKDQPIWRRAMLAVMTEVSGLHPRLHAYNLAAKLLPTRAHGMLRARLLRLAGFQVGDGTTINGFLKLNGPRHFQALLQMGRGCSIDADCVMDLSERVTLSDRVTLEPGVMILTSTHELDFPAHRAGKLVLGAVSIGDGAWLRARCIILPNVKIGAGAIVEAGAVVNKDVAPHTRVGGVPAIVLETLEA